MVRSARAALLRLVCLLAVMVVLPACTTPRHGAGSLLLIGGGLDDDNRPVYERFATLASRAGTPSIVIATAASGDSCRHLRSTHPRRSRRSPCRSRRSATGSYSC